MISLCCCFDGSNLAGLSLNFDDENIKKCKHKKIPLLRDFFMLSLPQEDS
jgi:hypothetical protein